MTVHVEGTYTRASPASECTAYLSGRGIPGDVPAPPAVAPPVAPPVATPGHSPQGPSSNGTASLMNAMLNVGTDLNPSTA
jgi:hypothetical protein